MFSKFKKYIFNISINIIISILELIYIHKYFQIFQNTILPEAVQFWEQALMVRETRHIIRLNR